MALTKRSDGRFCKKIKLPNGKIKYFYSSESTERKAEKDIEQQMLTYRENETKKTMFVSIAEKWNGEYRERISDINYRKGPKAAYEKIIKYFEDYAIADITAQHVNIFFSYLISRKYSQKTIQTHKSTLSMIFQYAILNGYTLYNPVNDIRLPSNLPKTPRKLPTTEELREVNKHYEGFDLFPFLLLNTGLRRSEALALTGESFDFDRKVIKVFAHIIYDGIKPVYENSVKTSAAERDVIILDRVIDKLPQKINGFLFSMEGDGKEPLTRHEFDKRWREYCKKYNLHITAHQLRHGYATMLFEAGIDVKDAQELMGHSDINLTRQIYTHIRSERMEETAKKLNEFNF